ncbi:sugar nucleotide-binding protein [Nonomuraea sp. NPDC046570]|uniref:SDR family oxidoreductase n=1 Tax=Nonomuraea sp. NPDC046570 TaxID=3155255 RepID=UPI003404D609
MTRLLVTGASGYVGRAVVRLATAQGFEVYGTRASPDLTWHRLDVSDRARTLELVTALAPTAVVHAAAGRHLNDWAVIADGAANVAVAAREAGARLVHISTDAVFGAGQAPYPESALPCPVNLYGAAKAAAETAVRAVSPDAVIARTSLVLGDGDSKHEQHVRELVADPGRGVLFDDALRNPVHVEDLAAALVELVSLDHEGVVHLGGADAISRYELGRLVAVRDGLDPGRVPAGSAAGLGVPYPLDTRLGGEVARRVLRTRLRGAAEFLRPGVR